MDPFVVKSAVKSLVLPPTSLLLIAVCALLMRRRWPRAAHAVAMSSLLLLLALSTPYVGNALLLALDRTPPLDFARAESAQAIVVLGGGVRRGALEFGGDTLGRLTLERVRYGAWVAKRLPLPVLVTGGSLYGAQTEARLMRQSLEQEFSVPVRWAEDQSRNTHENAVYTARILRDAGVRRAVLVAHSFDMPRVIAEFETQGIAIVPAPTALPSTEPPVIVDFVPSLGGLNASYYALYELLALAVLRIREATGA